MKRTFIREYEAWPRINLEYTAKYVKKSTKQIILGIEKHKE